MAARPLKSLADLEAVKGLGKTRADALRDRVAFAAPAPAVVEAPAAKTAATKPAAKAMTKPGAVAEATKPAATRLAPGQTVNLNSASKDLLDALPGIGPVKAQAIIEARPFKTKEDVMKVKGIKEGEFAKIKDLITVD